MIKLFDEFPRVERGGILLRKLGYKDIPALCELTGNENVYRYLPAFLFEKQYDDMREMIDALYGSCFASRESLILGICSAENDALYGLAEYYGYKDAIHKTCVGYRLLERYWNRGIATGTVAMMVDYLYTRTDIGIITASTMIENKASARVLEKNGFIKTVSGVPEDWGYDSPVIADKWIR